MDFYFSGIDAPKWMDILQQNNAKGMVYYTFMHDRKLSDVIYTTESLQELELVVDSSAYRGDTNLYDYDYKLRKYGWRYKWAANLDVIGDQDASDSNYDFLSRKHPNILWVYQIEGGRPMKYIEQYAYNKKVGIGGLVPLINRDIYRAIKLLGEIGEVLTDVNGTAHFFGVSAPEIILQYKHQPWFDSVDSSNWLNGIRGRRCLNLNGEYTNITQAGYEFTGEEISAQNLRVYQKWADPSYTGELSLRRFLRRK